MADDLTKTESFVIKPQTGLLWARLFFLNAGLPFESFHYRKGVTTPGLYLQWTIVFQSYTVLVMDSITRRQTQEENCGLTYRMLGCLKALFW